MHTQSLAYWTHDHTFLGARHGEHERRTWLVGPGHAAVIAAIVADRPEPPDRYKERLKELDGR